MRKAKILRLQLIAGGMLLVFAVTHGEESQDSKYDTDAGSFFVKTNRSIGPSMFEGEALGLNAMYETESIRVPKPYKVGPLPTGGSYIIMEFIEFGASRGNQANVASGMVKFLELKAKRTCRFIVYKIEDNQVIVEKLGEPAESYEDFAACLPEDECRYAVYDFDFVTAESC